MPFAVREQFVFATDVVGPLLNGDTIQTSGIGNPDLYDTVTFTTIGPAGPWRSFATQPGGGLVYSLQIEHLHGGAELASVLGFVGSGRKVFMVYPLASGDGTELCQAIWDQGSPIGVRPAGVAYTGVVWRCSDPNNFWYALLEKGTGTVTINVFMHKVVAGVDSFVQAGSYTVPDSTTANLALPINVILSGTTMELRDGTGALIMTAVDSFNVNAPYIGGMWNVEEAYPHDGFDLFDNVGPVAAPSTGQFVFGAVG